LIGETLTVNW